MSSFFPSSVWPNEGENNFKLLKQYYLHVLFVKQSIHSIITYSGDAAASGGPYSTCNNSQTPSRYNWALTLGWMGPCCQSPSKERNTDRKVNILDIKCVFLRCVQRVCVCIAVNNSNRIFSLGETRMLSDPTLTFTVQLLTSINRGGGWK